jgi:hypothetical protein
MIAAWGSYTFTFYAILDIIMATLVYLFLKETKGRSIEEMETIFHSKAAFDVEAARHKAWESEDVETVSRVGTGAGESTDGKVAVVEDGTKT